MAKLLGKKVSDPVVEIFGPQQGRNHFSIAVAPTVEIQVFGAGEVQLQENLEHVLVGERASNIGSQGAINTEVYANPVVGAGGWLAVGAVIDSGDGLVVRSPTVGTTDPTFLRLVVTVAGGGWVHMTSKWN